MNTRGGGDDWFQPDGMEQNARDWALILNKTWGMNPNDATRQRYTFWASLGSLAS